MKKSIKILIIVLSICVIIFAVYFGYSLTLTNANDSNNIEKHLTIDKDNPPEILAIDKLDDYVTVVYLDKSFSDTTFARVVFEKNKFYKNKYNKVADGHSTNWGSDCGLFIQNTPHDKEIKNTDNKKLYYYVYGFVDKNTNYKVICNNLNKGNNTIYNNSITTKGKCYLKMFSITSSNDKTFDYDLSNLEIEIEK